MDKPFDEWRVVALPDGSRVVLASRYADGSDLSLYDENHNVVRLSANGALLWQVQRDECGRYDFEKHRKLAIEAGLMDEPRNGFISVLPGLFYGHKRPYEGEELVPGLKLILMTEVRLMPYRTAINMIYELDIDTGQAINVSPPGPRRPW